MDADLLARLPLKAKITHFDCLLKLPLMRADL